MTERWYVEAENDHMDHSMELWYSLRMAPFEFPKMAGRTDCEFLA
jgi:hypothetical protein